MSSKKKKSYLLSILLLLVFAALGAARDVSAKELFTENLDPVFLTWLACLSTAVAFYTIVSIRTRSPYRFQEIRELPAVRRRQLVYANIATVVGFAATFLAIRELNAYVFSIVDHGAIPMITAFLAIGLRQEKVRGSAMLGMVVSLAGIVGLVLATRGHEEVTKIDTAIGYIYAFVGCLCFALNQIWNKDLVESGFVRERLLISRMILAILALGGYLSLNWPPMPQMSVWILVAWCILGVSIPLYILVYCLESVEVKHVAAIMFVIPVLTFLGSWYMKQLDPGSSVWLSAAAGAVVLLGVGVAEYANRPTVPTDPDSLRLEKPVEVPA
jgi:drug/metabolite transporter (DMT)-like permease